MSAHLRIVRDGQAALVGLAVVLSTFTCIQSAKAGGGKRGGVVSREFAEGRELFVKLWEPGVRSPNGGDGLGPLYNERSCVGCHNQGGVGGGGNNSKNVTLLCALSGATSAQRDSTLFRGELEDLHPGLRNRPAVVLHKFAVCSDDEGRLNGMQQFRAVQTRDDLVALSNSRRNTPALFGLGLVDRVGDKTLHEADKRSFPMFPEISGRVSSLGGGRIGRFGWKGQTATLHEFVLNACSNELGLEVAGRHQPSLLAAADFDPKALSLDLDVDQTSHLAHFVNQLPRPTLRPKAALETVRQGRLVFDSIGCAACHTPRLGNVDGLYSDLLLHDMGERFRDFGGYGSSARVIVDVDFDETAADPTGEAASTEWRTPPLWGVADSAPYLHDGRADTLHEAIQLHGGEAAKTSQRYVRLNHFDQQALLAFLHSLRAPQAEDVGKRRR